ncbi:DUF2207 domain-containing protein [Ornithinibacillus halotolerans]|uniref:DUF2207 domain-containing protein n=1 Tax=Ornithinibacillus halotolerans TaxID=1274357 RepID=A0A916RWL8_9BACI|nr:DUF2207 domain-containing protein [Ornithinibacillus halotolerans]GGA74247.1 hypothetical protein GCM10008025_17510 [Ornithinibacillus halotolerans]
MKKVIGLFTIVIIGLLIFPMQILAVDFTINKTNIDAYLQGNGDVHVVESHTYDFDGDFNGITRTIYPKKGATIKDFKAIENGNSLKVRLDDETYKIYRSGEDESITIELNYVIIDGVEVYTDMVQFYWPFFDSNNESDYENLTITVHPPAATSDTIAFGYDAAYGNQQIDNNGVVTFQLGLVESGQNGDIRVAYDRSIFSAAITHNESIQHTLLQEQQELKDKQLDFLEWQGNLDKVAPFVIGSFGLFLLLLLFFAWRKKHTILREVERQASQSVIPKERMSMPATIYHLRNAMVDFGDMLTIGMMDLVRKGNIKVTEKDTYTLVNSKTEYEHERQLIHLLFKKIGENGIFTFEKLEHYMKSALNKKSLYNDLSMYQGALVQEINSHQLFHNFTKLRWFIGITSLFLIPFMILLGLYQLFMWLFFALIMMFALLFFSFLFKVRTVEGKLIKHEWKQFKENFSTIQTNHWYNLSKDDKERALLFSTGMKDKKLVDINKSLIKKDASIQDDSSYLVLQLITLSTLASVNFGSVSNVSAESSTTTTTFTGTGVGGGGGGSGAF